MFRPHRYGPRIDVVSEVPEPSPRGWQVLAKLASSLDRLTLTTLAGYDALNVFSPDLREIVGDADGVGLPVQLDIGNVRLSPQGLLDCGSASQTVHVPQLESGVLYGRYF